MGDFLVREFCNHTYLGQCELARACASNLIRSTVYPEEDKVKLISILQFIAKDPYFARSAWPTLPCSSYISFLSCQLLFDLGHEDVCKAQKNIADFNILVELGLGTSEKIGKELSHMYSKMIINESDFPNKESIPNFEVSNECITVLKSSFKKNPVPVSLLMNKLYSCNSTQVNSSLNSIFCIIYYQLLLNSLKLAESSFFKKENIELLKNLTSKIYHLLSLLPDFILDESKKTEMDNIFLCILDLCKSGVLKLKKVYASLLGRSSSELLQFFCKLENMKLMSKESEINRLESPKPIFITDSGSFNHRTSLFWSLHCESHFLQYLMEYCINTILTDNWSYVNNLKGIPVPMLNLFLILSWEKCHDNDSALNVMQAIKMCNESEEDSLIATACKKFKLNISLTEMCISNYVEIFPKHESSDVQSQTRKILSRLQTQSLLKVLHSVFGLKNIPPDRLRNMLKYNQENLSDRCLNPLSYVTDESVYSGYIIMVLIMEAIYSCHEFSGIMDSKRIDMSSILYKPAELSRDSNSKSEHNYEGVSEIKVMLNFISKHGCQMAYSKFIIQKLENARQKLKDLFPLSFRVEILENIFSMLFLMAQNLVDFSEQYYDSDQGYEGEASLFDKIDSFSVHSVDAAEKRYEGRFIVSTVKLKDGLKNDISENASDHISSKSTESTNSNGFQPYTFLCNELIVRDLLSLLKDCTLEAKAEVYKLIAVQDVNVIHETSAKAVDMQHEMKPPGNYFELPERTSRLLQYINEAIWRYEVVKTGIFQERMSFYDQQRNKPHLFQSQFSTSSSEGTDKETKKHHKRKKRKRSCSSRKDESVAESSIIQCMLSSSEALLRYSLWNGNLKQAGQVIDLFKLQTSNEAKEITLFNELEKIANKIVTSDKVKEKHRKKCSSGDDKSVSSNISTIKNVVAFGLHSSNLYMTVTEELSSLEVLKTMDITGGVCHPELLLSSKNIYPILLIDLAYVSDISIELTSSLLDSANKSWININSNINELDAKVLSRKKMPLIRGNSKTLNMMNSLLKEMLSFLKENDTVCDLNSIFWPLKKQFRTLSQALPNFMGNLDHRRFQEEANNWANTCRLIEEFSILLEEEELNEQKGVLVKDIKRENKLHMAYKKLSQTLRELRDWSSGTIRPEVIHYVNYLSKLFIHLRQVTTAALECKNQSINSGHAIYTSDFSILKESPVELLKKIILQKGVTPEKIEIFAVRMKVDLGRVLAQACLPYVPLSKENISVDKLLMSSCQISDIGYPVYILNMAREIQACPQPKHPDLVAQELLRDLITMIQETAMVNDTNGIFKGEELLSLTQHSQLIRWMEECSQLAFVDLDLLQTREEKLAFFGNVANIAWMYAILLQTLLGKSQEKEKEENDTPHYSESNFNNKTDYSEELLLSPNLLERLTIQKVIGFSVGQLGPISLFDLRYQFLHAHISAPKHLEASPFNKLLGNENPVWQKYMPPLEPRLLFVLTEGLMYSPKLQVIYSENIDDILEKAMKDYYDFTIHIDKENDTVTLPELLEWYSVDFSKDDENCLDKAPYEGLIYLLSTLVRSPLSEKFQQILSDDSAYNFSENIDSSGKKQLPFTLEFKGPDAVLGIMLEYAKQPNLIQPTATQTPPLMDSQPIIINYLKKKCHILTDLYEIIIHENPSQYLSQLNNNIPVFNLLKHYHNLHIALDSSFSWFSSALSPYPDRRYFIKQIEYCFTANNWHQALLYLDIYLECCGKAEFSLNLCRQLILEHVASIDPSTSSLEPSNYALCISDPLCRAKTVLLNVNKWSEHSALKALKYCLSDSKIPEYPEVQQSLRHKLKKITLYKRIADASEMYGSSEAKDCVYVFNNWQEVADCSVWDQSRILEFLNSCEKYDLAVEWSEMNVINSQQKVAALSMILLSYLSQDPPNEQALKVLDSLEDTSDCLNLCNIVLPKLSTIEAKLCLIQYIVRNISCDNQHYYHNMLLGLKMLSSLRSPVRESYADLAGYPYLILEQMLMNAELKDAEKSLKAIENDLKSLTDVIPVMNNSSVNQLVEDYASKALEVHFLDALLDTSSSSTLVLSIDDSVVTDEPFVMPARVPTKEEWVPDAKIHRCQVCKEEHFNMFNRRHHCRRCGRVVCANCSQHALIVEGYENVKVRVCEECYNLMTGSISVTSSSFDKRYRVLSSMQSSPRNSPYQEHIGFRRRSSSFQGHQQTFRWVLSSDSKQNASVRNEFSYEQAPSISLCYSIMKLHNDPKKCAQFMLNLCDRLLGKIKPRRSGKIPIEVDCSLIISMIKSLLVSAKVKCHQVHDSEGEALADLYFQHLDIMKLLVNANCRHLLPREALTGSDSARKLRNKLLEEERMSLALEVSTKFNLDKAGVWSSWGLFCIRGGDLPAARTKFQQCLKVISDKSNPKQENPLLNKILEVLEKSKHAGTEKAAAIYKSLSYLKSIENGSNWLKSENSTLDGLIKKECLYYLNTYGTHCSTIRFYQRNNLTCEALSYILEKKCEPDIFIDAVFMSMLKNVQLSSLKHNLTSIDPTLSVWWNYLFATCRFLARLKYFNVLYEMQLFMEDYARAAKSAINFYLASASSYKVLFERHRYLYNAKKHYEKHLRDSRESVLRRNKNIKILPTKEVESYIEIIGLQEEVALFFQQCISQNNQASLFEPKFTEKKDSKISTLPPTLFGNPQKKFHVTLMVILNAVNIDEGFDLAIKIIQTLGLDSTAILCEAGKKLVRMNQKIQIPHFLACVKCFFSKMVKVDEVILECVSEINKQHGDVEDIIKMLTSDVNKINAYLMCDKLKSAYLLAIKLKSALDVRRVLVAAEQSGQAAIQEICKRWLEINLPSKPQ